MTMMPKEGQDVFSGDVVCGGVRSRLPVLTTPTAGRYLGFNTLVDNCCCGVRLIGWQHP